MQYVILTYMKHLGVKVKEPRNLEQKRGRIGFLPKIKVIALLDSLEFKPTLALGMILQCSMHRGDLGLLRQPRS